MEQVIDIIYTLFIVRVSIRLTGMSEFNDSVEAKKLILDTQTNLISGFQDIYTVLYRFATMWMMVLGGEQQPSAEGFKLHAENFYNTHVPVGFGITEKKKLVKRPGRRVPSGLG